MSTARKNFEGDFSENHRQIVGSGGALNSPVYSTGIPHSYRQLLTDEHFSVYGWHRYYGQKENEFFVIEGLDALLGALRKDRPNFLKQDKYIDLEPFPEIHSVIRQWENQSGCSLDHRISINFVKNLAERKPERFYIGLRAILACHLAMKALVPEVNPLFPFDYMRLRPVVYNIQNFTPANLKKLRQLDPNFDEDSIKFCGQNTPRILDDIAKGYTVTYRTASLLKHFLKARFGNSGSPVIKQMRKFEITSEPQKREIANIKCSENELFSVR